MDHPQAQQGKVDEHVFLVGRPPLGEYLGFIATLTVGGSAIPQGTLAAEWRKANDHVHELEIDEAGWADKPEIKVVPSSQERLAKEVYADPMFQRSFQVVPTDIGIVQLDRLVVFQKSINLTYVRSLQAGLGKKPNEEEIFRFCLSVKHPHPPVRVAQTAANSFTFISPSNDFRFVESRLLGTADIASYIPQGPVTGVLGLVLGYGSNFVTALEVENRLILVNGSHRAYALREMGIDRIPCLIEHISRREELEVVIAGELVQKPDLFLKAARPPLLKDYFDPALRKLVGVTRKDRLVRVTFGIEQSDIPAN